MTHPISISVVVPLFNKETAIASTLSSVLAQTRPPDELIVIDDGSTDESAAVAERILSKAPERISSRVISQPNAGEGAARNRAADESRSRYIAFLDADDLWLPDYLAEAERLATSFPSATVLTIRSARRNSSGSLVPGPSVLGSGFFGLLQRPIDEYRKSYGILNSSCVIIRRDAWERVGPFDVGAPTGADVLLWLKLGLSETFAHSGKALSIWRDEYSAIASRKWTVPRHLQYFLGSDEGRRHLDNPDLAKFLEANLIMQIGVYSVIGNRKIRRQFRRFAAALPMGSRARCLAASYIPAVAYRGLAWWRRSARERRSAAAVADARKS